jgi:hypothetical protein
LDEDTDYVSEIALGSLVMEVVSYSL